MPTPRLRLPKDSLPSSSIRSRAGYQDMSLAALIGGTADQVAAAREAVGPDVDIILELHRKLTPLQAVPLCEALVQFRPLLIEDPVQIDSIQSQAEIAKRITCALANGERMHTVWEFREMLVAGGAQYIRPDVGLAGGTDPHQEDRRDRRVVPRRAGAAQLPRAGVDGGVGAPGRVRPELHGSGVLEGGRGAGRRVPRYVQARGRLHQAPRGARPRA